MIRTAHSALYLPHLLPDMVRWLDICGRHCAHRGYPVVGVVHTWDEAMRMMFDGRADVLVAGRRDHLPIDRSPRLEIVTEEQALEVTISQQRPARRIQARPSS